MSKKQKAFFVTGIDTEIGKTIISSILVEGLKADYWKPVQSGDLDNSDTMKVKSLVTNDQSTFHQETFRLNTPASPHASAAIDNVKIELNDFKLPLYDNDYLIIEGAGGLMVPLNEEECIIDLMVKLEIPVILVSKNYLGSINHTLMSIAILKQRQIPIAGVIFNGKETKTTQDIIEKMESIPILGRIDELENINKESISEASKSLKLEAL